MENKEIEILKCLAENGANLNIKNQEGCNIAYAAATNGTHNRFFLF